MTVPAIYLTLGHTASTSRRRIVSNAGRVRLGTSGKVVDVYLCHGAFIGIPDQRNSPSAGMKLRASKSVSIGAKTHVVNQ